MKFLWEVKAAEDFSTLSLQENGTLNAVCFYLHTEPRSLCAKSKHSL